MDRRLHDRVTAWVDAGLITPDQAERITHHEHGRAPGRRRTGTAEAVGYVGAALAVSAMLLLVGELWEDVVVGGRLALTLLVAVAALAAGAALRSSDDEAIQRLVSVLWLVGVAGIGWVAWVVAHDLLQLRDADVALVVSSAVAVSGAALHVVRRRMLSQLAVLFGTGGVVLSLLGQPALSPDAVWWGLALWGLGIAWALVGAGGWLRPVVVAEAAGTTLGVIGAQVGSFGDERLAMLVLGVVTAAALAWLATHREGVHLLAVGALSLFVLVPQLAFELFGDAIGAPATLLVVGLLLVLLAVGLGRVRREVEPARRPGTTAKGADRVGAEGGGAEGHGAERDGAEPGGADPSGADRGDPERGAAEREGGR